MPDQQPQPDQSPPLQRERAAVRRGLRRANLAVACALLAVMTLATLATVGSLRARQSQQRAEEAQEAARVELGRALLADIRALRQDKTLGRRPAAMASIRRAAAIAPSPELRDEAAASLALPDFQPDSEHDKMPAEPAAVRYAFDRGLRWVAWGLTNGDVVVRETREQREIARLRMAEGGIPARQIGPDLMEFSPDGTRLSVRYGRGGLAVWDWQKGRTVFRHDMEASGHIAARGRFSGDGRVLVGPVFGPKDGMAAFDLESGRMLAHFPEIGSYHHVAVRPGGTLFAAHTGSNVVVMDWVTKQRVASFEFGAGVRLLAWSEDGRQLALVGNLLETHVWDFERRQRRALIGHKNDIFNVAFDPSGDRLVTASFDGTSRLWDLRDGRLIGVVSDAWITQWGPEDRLVLEKPGGGLELRRLIPSPVHRELSGPENVSNGRTMDLSPDGRWVVSAAGRQHLQIWDLESDAGPSTLPVERLRSLTFRPTEPALILTRSGGPNAFPCVVVTNQARATVRLGAPSPLSAIGDRRVDLVTSSADGRSLAWVDLAVGRAWVQSLDSNAPVVALSGLRHNTTASHSSSVRGGGTISLSRDGRWLACGVSENGVVVFDARSGALVRRLVEGEASVQFSRDGRWLAAIGKSQHHLFRVSDWSQVWARAQPRVQQPAGAFSPDGVWLAVTKTPHSTALMDAATGRELVELQSPDPAPVMTMRWSDDGRRLVCATRENHVEIWEPAVLRRELAALGLDWAAPSPDPVRSVPVLDQGRAVAVALGIFAVAGLVAIIALLALRRHHWLLERFAKTEALAAQREQELAGEREIRQIKDTFVSMVSHEFRTPLGIIQSSAQILDRYLERLPPEQRREQLASITKNVRRMAGLIDEVLLLGKVEGGQLRCTPAPLDLAVFCRKLADEMHSATSGRCPIRLELALLPLPLARVDEALLRHMLTNLLSNGVKYSPAGRPVWFSVTRQGDHAVFTIRDEGLGIPVADRAKLFTAFHRGANVGTVSGTGLGLTIVKRCVDLHGGDVRFDSTEGRGTTFTVTLPVFAEPPPTLNSTPPSSHESNSRD